MDIIWYEQNRFLHNVVPPGEDPTIFIPISPQTGMLIPGIRTKRFFQLEPTDTIRWLDPARNAQPAPAPQPAPGREEEGPGRSTVQEGEVPQNKPYNPKHSKVRDLPFPPSKEVIEGTKMNPKALENMHLEYLLPKISHLPKEQFLRWGERGADGNFILDPDDNLSDELIEFIIGNGLIPEVIINTEIYSISISKRNLRPGKPNYELFIFKPKLIHAKNQPIFQKVANFMKQEDYFIYNYRATVPTATERDYGHVVLMKKRNPFTLIVLDPTGEPWDSPTRAMTPASRELTRILFTKAGFTEVEDQSCELQSTRGTCSLWSLLFALYPEKTSEQIRMMIDDVIRVVGLPPGPEAREMVIKELFFEFMQRPVLASSVNREEHRQGLGKRKLKGKALPDDLTVLQQIAKQSYNLTDPQEDVNGWILKKWTPTMKFYVKGNDVIVGVRGTKTNAPDGNFDVSADLTIPFNGIPGTTRYKRDKAAVQQFLQKFPSPEYSYYAVGHSLGGAIIDSLIRDKLIKEALSYNPAIQSGDINAGLPNRRIYFGSDPLYRLMGWLDRKSEHREPKSRTWADFLGTFSPAAAAMAALPAHNLSNFEGGKRGKLGKKVVFT
jgi:hypothetical protein